jgi:hypothetical protein
VKQRRPQRGAPEALSQHLLASTQMANASPMPFMQGSTTTAIDGNSVVHGVAAPREHQQAGDWRPIPCEVLTTLRASKGMR